MSEMMDFLTPQVLALFTTLTCLAFNTAQVDRLQAGERLVQKRHIEVTMLPGEIET